MATGRIVAPIHVSIWPTAKCQLKCSYCCCRNIENNGVELAIEGFEKTIDILYSHGTKAIEFSGGGEPLLWKYFNNAVEYAFDKGLKISLITNGIELNNVPESILEKLSWVRVSITSLSQIEKVDILRIYKKTNISASYILPDKSDTSIVSHLYALAVEKNIKIRFAVQRPATRQREEYVKNEVEKYGDPLFFSHKESGSPKGCYMPWVRAAIDWNGNFLPCPAIQLNFSSEGYIPEKFILCHISKLKEWIENNNAHDLGHRCSFCNCGKEINDYIDSILTKIEDVDFV